MNRHMSKAGLLLAVFTLLCLAGPMMAQDALPFQGTVSGSSTRSATNDPCLFLVTISGAGQATYLGNFTWQSTHTLNVCTTPFTVSGGSLTLTAADGDQLFGTYTGTSHVIPNTTPPVIAFDVTITITGGTGRFANTTGTIEGTGQADTGTGAATATLAGTISSVGPD
jgi:hypothetical protein